MLLWPLLLTAALSGRGVSASGAPVAPLPGYAIQPAGTFHAGEPVARGGEAWLGLLTHGDDSALVATRVQLRAVHDAVVDAPGQATGVEVASALGEEARYFLRGPNLAAGAVESTGFTPVARDTTAPHHVFRFHGQDYRIDTRCRRRPDDADVGQVQFDCALMLHGAGRSQQLFAIGGYAEHDAGPVLLGDDGNAALLFVGDLDRDGRPDLIFDASDHYNVARPTLFLSSPAGPDEFVRQVAQYESVGC